MTHEEALKLIPCPFYSSGNCRFGDYCNLQHESHSLATAKSVKTGDAVCGICLDDVLQAGSKFGLLSCCQHTFCFKCLMEWRTEGSEEAEDRRTCPICRKKSDYVVPSSINPVDNDAKEVIVNEYRTRLGRIPCKKFDGSLESCPYGSGCFYAHIDEEGENCKSDDLTMKELWEKRRNQRSRSQRRRNGFERDIVENFANMLMMMHYNDFDEVDDDDDLASLASALLSTMHH